MVNEASSTTQSKLNSPSSPPCFTFDMPGTDSVSAALFKSAIYALRGMVAVGYAGDCGYGGVGGGLCSRRGGSPRTRTCGLGKRGPKLGILSTLRKAGR